MFSTQKGLYAVVELEELDEVQELENPKQKKGPRTALLVLLIVILTLALVAGCTAGWYFLRPTYRWSVSEDGVLTITGITVIDFDTKELVVTGSVPEFTGDAPWVKQNAIIHTVQVDETITSMSDTALSGLTAVTSVELPKALAWNGIDTVTVPSVHDHLGEWITSTDRRHTTYTANYREIFTITFMLGDEVFATVDYADGDTSISEPDIPEKNGYLSHWEPYTLDGDATVSAVYTYAIQTGTLTEKVNMHTEAGTDTKTIGTLSKGMTVALLEEADIDGTVWYRMDMGWICGDYVTDLTYVGSGLAEHMGITATDCTVSDETAAAILTGIQLLTAREYDVGFMLVDLDSGKSISYNADTEFYSASTIKGPYVVSVLNRSPDAAKSFWGTIQEILVNSSNDDYNRLRNTYGKTPMELWCEAAGVDTEVADNYYPAITAEELCKLWIQNYEYFTTAENGETVAKWFQKPDKSPIHSVLGGKYTTQTKAGWIEGTTDYYQAASDAGIVYADSGTYAVAIVSNGRSNLTLLNTLIEALDAAHDEM